MERQLRKVEQLPADQAAAVLELPATTAPVETEETDAGENEET